MALIVADRVLEISTTTGTGALTLAGAVTGFRAASAVCADGDTLYYFIEEVDGSGIPTGAWETGLGTWGTGGILTRTAVHASSNAGSAVNFAAGTKRVGLTLTAESTTSTSALIQAARIQCIPIACGDETTDLTAGTAKVTFRMPYAFTLTAVRASVTTAPTGGTLLTVDINESGATILSTKLTFDDSEKTTTTAATAAVISDTALADDAEITIDVDTVGSTIAGAGLKVYLIGTRT